MTRESYFRRVHFYPTTSNYWDRVGDLIASFFPKSIKPDRVFFGTAIGVIPAQFHNSPNYLWLKSFLDNEYNELNGLRKEIVHYHTTDTTYKYDHLNQGGLDKREQVKAIQQEREQIADFYKKHIALTIEGLEKTLLLLAEFDAAFYSHIE